MIDDNITDVAVYVDAVLRLSAARGAYAQRMMLLTRYADDVDGRQRAR